MKSKIVSLISILALSIGSFFAFFSPKKNEVAYADIYNVLPDIFVNVNNERNLIGDSYRPFVVKFSPDLSSFSDGSFSFYGYDRTYDYLLTEYYSASYTFALSVWQTVYFSNVDDTYSFVVQYYCDTNFVFDNVVQINFWGITSSSPHPRNVVRFLDSNGNRFQFDFWCYYIQNSSDVPGLLYQEEVRTLFTAPVDSTTTTFQNAYQNGYDNGRIAGQEIGYTDGYNVGYSSGDAVGYQRGVDASNQYSFGNLLFAVVDTPVVIFRSLFDFNVLGVNLQGFFFSLLTVAVVIAVVRFILAR